MLRLSFFLQAGKMIAKPAGDEGACAGQIRAGSSVACGLAIVIFPHFLPSYLNISGQFFQILFFFPLRMPVKSNRNVWWCV